jgi:hypothetical protein
MNAPTETLLAEAEDYASKGILSEAFQHAAKALLSRPGDPEILAFIAGLNYQPIVNHPKPSPAAAVNFAPPAADFNTAPVKAWPQAYFGGHPQRYEHNYAKYLERGGLVKPGIDVRAFTAVTGVEAGGRRADMSRYYLFCLAFDQIVKEALAGDFAELGVDKGHTAGLLATFARRIGATVYLLDTFEGFSPRDLQGIDAGRRIEFADASLENVRACVGEENVRYIKGYFPESAAQMPDGLKFSLVHIDCDLHAPVLSALQYFYPRMTPGGFIIIHDYNSLYWDGAENAVDEFFRDKPEAVVPVPDICGSVAVRKARTAAPNRR